MKMFPERAVNNDDFQALDFHLAQNLSWDSNKRYIVFSAGAQAGKDVAVNTLIPTPSGFKSMGSIEVGDYVYASDGTPTLVIYTSPVFTDHKCYKITFDDGNEIIAGEDHQWLVRDARRRKNDSRRVKVRSNRHVNLNNTPSITGQVVVKTKQMLKKMTAINGSANWSIDVLSSPVSGLNIKLPLHPYLMGQWLGDGNSNGPIITTMDAEAINKIKKLGYKAREIESDNCGKASQYKIGYNTKFGNDNRRINNITKILKELNVLNNKHIPSMYLNASIEDRRELLAGLLDSDGYCNNKGQAEFYSTRKVLFDDFVALACSLGYKVRTRRRIAKLNGKSCGFVYTAVFSSDNSPFYVSRKREGHIPPQKKNTKRRYVYSIEEVKTVPTKCISVAHESHTYLITKAHIVTHNTTFGPKWLLREIYHPVIGRGGGDYLAVTATFDLFKMKMLPSMLNVFQRIYGVGKYWGAERIIELRDPESGEFWARRSTDPMWGRLILRSADSPGGLESATAKAVWADEIGQERFTRNAYSAIKRRITIARARVLMTTTLYEPGWFLYEIIRPAKRDQKEIYVENERGELSYVNNDERNTFLVQFDSTINPSFSKEEFEENREFLDEEEFAMFFKGREGSSRFLVYSNFDFERHTCPMFSIPPSWDRYIGVDYGGAHTCAVFFAEDPGTNILYVYDAYLEGQLPIRDHVKNILSKCGARSVLTCGGAPNEDQWRREFGQYGLFVNRPLVHEVEVGIDRVNHTHKIDGIVYFDHLTGIIGQKANYRREKNPETGEPTQKIKNKNDFHYLDAERYIVSEIRPLGTNKVKVMRL